MERNNNIKLNNPDEGHLGKCDALSALSRKPERFFVSKSDWVLS